MLGGPKEDEMTTHPMPTSAANDKGGQILRPARALIGWMELEQGQADPGRQADGSRE
jgi:hypothetical protein